MGLGGRPSTCMEVMGFLQVWGFATVSFFYTRHTLFLLTPCYKLFLITFHAEQIKINIMDFILKSPADFILNLHRKFCERQSAAATDAQSAVERRSLPPSNRSLFVVGHKRSECTSPNIREAKIGVQASCATSQRYVHLILLILHHETSFNPFCMLYTLVTSH